MDMEVDDDVDLEAYISNYRGHIKIARLLHVASTTSSAHMRVDALRAAVADLKANSLHAELYISTCQSLQQLGEACEIDEAWVTQVRADSAALRNKLEDDLSAAKANSIRESMRQSTMDLGAFFYDRGDFVNASKMFMRTRDLCATNKQMMAFCMAVIRTYVNTANWPMVSTYVQKAESMADAKAEDALTRQFRAQLAAVAGLADLNLQRYRSAAAHFASVGADLGASFEDICTGADVARYGALTALAVHDRSLIRTRFLNQPGFSGYMENMLEARELLEAFCTSRYAEAFRILAALRPQLQADIYLSFQLDALMGQIRCRVLQQYTAPFKSLLLVDMAAALGCEVLALEQELVALIVQGAIAARIDSHNKILYKQENDERRATILKTVQAADAYIANAHAILLRNELMKCGLRPALAGDEGMVGGEGGRVARHSATRAGQLLSSMGEGLSSLLGGAMGRASRGDAPSAI